MCEIGWLIVVHDIKGNTGSVLIIAYISEIKISAFLCKASTVEVHFSDCLDIQQ